ncbi:MAG: hydroxymethylglutaryl-CoA lyase [Neomegalonema sp.]|nr:hydroxymethylglutaryl-CoA lyase [Neomegalonema sp.]
MADEVLIFEMGPRDGLQNIKAHVATADKIRFVDLLSEVGFQKIETASFVSPKAVPRMADSAEVMAGVKRKPAVLYTALTPNMRGYAAAKAARVDEVAIFASASEGFSRANINCSIAESIERFQPVAEAARADNLPMRAYVSCVTHCPYDGATPPKAVAELTKQLLELGAYEVSLGDTIGRAAPEDIGAMLDAVLTVAPAARLAGHYHDTGGRALENIQASLERGLRVFDAAAGGLGGCPYAPGAKGNVATEAVHAALTSWGLTTGLDAAALRRAAEFAQSFREERLQ